MWYDFGELQILKQAGGGFLFLNTGGNILEVDESMAALFLSLQNHSVEETIALMEEAGYPMPRTKIEEVIQFLLSEKMVKIDKKKPKAYRYDVRQALSNLKEVEQGPVFIQDICFTITNACPLKCDYCFRKEFDYASRVLISRLKEVNTDLRRLACYTINFSGGEPSIASKAVCELASDCREKGFQNISVNTSGFRLDRKKLTEWKEAGVTFLNIKLDSMDPALHDLQLGWTGAYQMALDCIRNSVKVGIQARVNCTAYYEAIPTLDELIQFCHDVGVYKLRINPYVPRPGKLAPVHPKVYKMVSQKVRSYQMKGYNVYSPINDYDEMPDLMICSAGILKAVIETDGSVGSCQFVGDWPKAAGNIFEQDFYDIWTKGDWGYYRKGLTTQRIAEPCYRCDWRKYCVSTCIAYAQALFGDGKITQPIDCPFYKKEGKRQDVSLKRSAKLQALAYSP